MRRVTSRRSRRAATDCWPTIAWLDARGADAVCRRRACAQSVPVDAACAPDAHRPKPRRRGPVAGARRSARAASCRWLASLVVLAVAARRGGVVACASRAAATSVRRSQGTLAAPRRRRSRALDYQRITSLPGDESWPSVSPDGGQVAYSAYSATSESASLMVQATAPVPPRELTPVVKGRSDVMAGVVARWPADRVHPLRGQGRLFVDC